MPFEHIADLDAVRDFLLPFQSVIRGKILYFCKPVARKVRVDIGDGFKEKSGWSDALNIRKVDFLGFRKDLLPSDNPLG